jgi:5-formaminoimidazole-4-carboxamide-1-(beta)-D-ribofuranosyl 5'-monophosphate synthetase
MIRGEEIFEEYDRDAITVATLGSHTALQILKGAKEEGFRTLALCRKGREDLYRRFRVSDAVWTYEDYGGLLEKEAQEKLREENVVLVPHGSLIEYVGVEGIEEGLEVPLLGNRGILRWEAERDLERRWLERAGIEMPAEFRRAEEIRTLSIVKFPGAKGGRGYFLVQNGRDFEVKSRALLREGKLTQEDLERATIQEYIAGVNMYLSYFYSPLRGEVELFGIDRRCETNIDGLSRIPAVEQSGIEIEPSYVVVGNSPLVARESLLTQVLEMGDRLVEVSREGIPPGMVGPFCLETMITPEMRFIAFEISARIVAGTNLFIGGSPYSQLLHGPGMSMGRRIAWELREALENGKEEDLIT